MALVTSRETQITIKEKGVGMSYLFDPAGLVKLFEALGVHSPSVSKEGEGVQVFPCGVQCEMLLGHARYRGSVISIQVSTVERFAVVDYDWCCIWLEEFKRWSRVGSFKFKIPYHKYYWQKDEERVKIGMLLKGPSARFFKMDDYTHLIETKDGFFPRWYFPKMLTFRRVVIAILAKK
ncbi:MAG: hypothetical protein AAB649_02780 [Patescibacteria group bacterium]